MMIKRTMIALALLVLPQGASADDGSLIGQVLGSGVDQTINGWTDAGGGHYTVISYDGTKLNSTSTCCFAILRQGNDLILAITIPIARNSTGGVLAERIEKIKRLSTPPGMIEGQCQPLWLDPITSFMQEDGDEVVSYFYDGKDFRELHWRDKDMTGCDRGD